MINTILLPIIIPLATALAIVILPKIRSGLAIVGTLLNLIVAISLFRQDYSYSLPWAGFGIEFILRIYHFSAFILLSIAGFASVYAVLQHVYERQRKAQPVLRLFVNIHDDG
jgi:formate hydrogenlyase subunit 3/multisubunit Na+/H+ antiporter MnhD subunit